MPASAEDDGTIRERNALKGEELRVLCRLTTQRFCVTTDQYEKMLIHGGRDQLVTLTDISTHETVKSMETILLSCCLAGQRRQRKHSVVGTRTTGPLFAGLTVSRRGSRGLSFASDGDSIIAPGTANDAKSWSTSSVDELRSFRGQQSRVWTCVVSPDWYEESLEPASRNIRPCRAGDRHCEERGCFESDSIGDKLA